MAILSIIVHHLRIRKSLSRLNKNNDILLGKLLQISKGKNTHLKKVNGDTSRITSGSQILISSESGPIKSLHYFRKKREFDRIEKENMRMINRITNQGSTMSLKKMNKEYLEKKKLMAQISKPAHSTEAILNAILNIKQKVNQKAGSHLPPISAGMSILIYCFKIKLNY